MQSHKVARELTPGRVLLVTHGHHVNKLAILLQAIIKQNKGAYKVLILVDDQVNPDESPMNDMWYKMLSLSLGKIFSPMGVVKHEVLCIEAPDILEICPKHFKIDSELIINDWDKRQIPRFRGDPPGQSCQNAIQELYQLTLSTVKEDKLQYFDFILDLKIDDAQLYEIVKKLNHLHEKVMNEVVFIQVSSFEQHFKSIFKRKSLEEELHESKYLLSHASMSLYPDYESRIKLLQELNYVDAENRGSVTCIGLANKSVWFPFMCCFILIYVTFLATTTQLCCPFQCRNTRYINYLCIALFLFYVLLSKWRFILCIISIFCCFILKTIFEL